MDKNTAFVSSLTDDKCDPELGARVKRHLRSLGLENTYDQDINTNLALPPVYSPTTAYDALKTGIYNAYKHLNLDVDGDPSIQDTPRRFAKMFVGELTRGLNYDFFPKCTATPNGIEIDAHPPETQSRIDPKERKKSIGKYDQMVLVKDIVTVSLCEHHLQTIDGVTHIAYIPNGKVLGLSKFARVAEFFAARPQIQERMTEQTHAALCYILETEDVAVIQDSVHFCMRARGVKQPSSRTQTDKMTGRFLTNPSLRQELLNATRP